VPGSKLLHVRKGVCFSLESLGSCTNIRPVLGIACCVYYTTFRYFALPPSSG
jgi:hypothetical protein